MYHTHIRSISQGTSPVYDLIQNIKIFEKCCTDIPGISPYNVVNIPVLFGAFFSKWWALTQCRVNRTYSYHFGSSDKQEAEINFTITTFVLISETAYFFFWISEEDFVGKKVLKRNMLFKDQLLGHYEKYQITLLFHHLSLASNDSIFYWICVIIVRSLNTFSLSRIPKKESWK